MQKRTLQAHSTERMMQMITGSHDPVGSRGGLTVEEVSSGWKNGDGHEIPLSIFSCSHRHHFCESACFCHRLLCAVRT